METMRQIQGKFVYHANGKRKLTGNNYTEKEAKQEIIILQ